MRDLEFGVFRTSVPASCHCPSTFLTRGAQCFGKVFNMIIDHEEDFIRPAAGCVFFFLATQMVFSSKRFLQGWVSAVPGDGPEPLAFPLGHRG